VFEHGNKILLATLGITGYSLFSDNQKMSSESSNNFKFKFSVCLHSISN